MSKLESKAYMQQAECDLLHTYNRFGVIFDYGKGMYLYDAEGKKYLDFAAGIGVCALGYGNAEYTDALKEQAGKLLHTSNLYYSLPMIKAAEAVKRISGMDRVFFTNSGTEAVEGAIKAAKKYAYTRDGHAGHEIVAMEHSFHGRSLGALSVTGNAHYREPFEPLPGIVRFAEFNKIDSVKEQINEKTCAVILETVQGEGGIYPAAPEFLTELAALCKKKDILLIFDEIQCGMGRSGRMFAWQHYGIRPDLMTVAKALGSGVPVGAFLMTEHVAGKSLMPGDHGTTYGGNPLVCAAVCKTIEIFERERLTEHVQEAAAYLWKELEKRKENYACVTDHRGMGLMQGLQTAVPASGIVQKALERGLILITAGKDVIRFLPPLIVTSREIDEMLAILDGILEEI